jgi:hypothetical protein
LQPWATELGAVMTTYKKAADLLSEAIKDPKNKDKLTAAKQHPKLRKLLTGVTQDDLITLNKVAKGGGVIKCTQQ